MHEIINFSLRYRFLVVVSVLLLIGLGVEAMMTLPIDAVPDVTPNQVQILTDAPALSPLEVEQFITFPVETAMSGLPGIETIRSVSRFGLSAVTIYFREEMDIYFCRRLVMERMPQAREAIPPGFGTPEMGPISTGLGEIYQFQVKGEGYSLMELRSILDWDIAFKLRSVPGVVEVNTFGGELKTYQVEIDPDKLIGYNLSMAQVFEALEANNANAGGAYIVKNQGQYLVRGEGLVESLDQIGDIVVETDESGIPIYIRDVADVRLAPMVRQGAVTRDNQGEAVTGVVMMLIGENSRAVADRVRTRLEEIKKSLPPGVTVDTYYDRTSLVRKTVETVVKNLSEGGFLVILVLLLLLGSFRGGLMVASAIPLSMLLAFIGMRQLGLSGNLMSLGAIDFGLIVDGSVVIIENIVRHLSRKSEGPLDLLQSIRDAGKEVARPVVFAVGIIIIVYLPILTLEGVEGKMFRPMALTVILALVGSLILSLTLMPVLASFFFRGQLKEEEPWLIRQLKKAYQPLLCRAVAHPKITLAGAVLAFLGAMTLFPFMGAEFIPRLDEGAIALQAWRLPDVSLEDSLKSTSQIESVLKEFPEVITVVSRTGRPEIATDPMGVEISDIYIILKPQEQWRSASTKEELISKMDQALKRSVPGNIFSYSQPIELRVQELIAGVRSDVAIEIFGDDLAELKRLGDAVVRVISQVPGAADVKAEQISGLPYLRIVIDRRAIARYGINASQVLDVVRAVGGRTVGQILEGQKRFFFQVRFRKEARSDLKAISNLKIADPRGRLIPLSQLATLKTEVGPAQISRKNIHRRLAVEVNVRGRDLAGFVADAERAVESQVALPAGYWVEWGGQFENLQRASKRLTLVVPLAFVLILVLLQLTFNKVRPALLIFLNVPLAAVGGVFILVLRGMPLSISAAVGFIALFGVAVMNGLVLVTYIRDLVREGMAVEEAVIRGSLERMRAMIMAPLVAALGFVPMALSTSAGAEVQRPLATVVIGGLVTSTLVTLFVIPAIYGWFEEKRVEIEI